MCKIGIWNGKPPSISSANVLNAIKILKKKYQADL